MNGRKAGKFGLQIVLLGRKSAASETDGSEDAQHEEKPNKSRRVHPRLRLSGRRDPPLKVVEMLLRRQRRAHLTIQSHGCLPADLLSHRISRLLCSFHQHFSEDVTVKSKTCFSNLTSR